jgi:hypothetical protein
VEGNVKRMREKRNIYIGYGWKSRRQETTRKTKVEVDEY